MRDSKYLLTDEQMAHFITKGYVVLQNNLPQELHQNVMKQIHHVFHEEGNPGNNILPRVPDIRHFFDTPTVKGALSSVLGPDYYMHPHRHCHYNQPGNSSPGGGQWHKDGFWSSMRSHRPWWAMIFYYTHDVTEELGPTAIMPGTQYYDKFLGDRGETLLPTGKAGTMVLAHFDIWHKASLNVSNLDRYMLKFQFVRLQAPEYPSWNCTAKDMPLPEETPIMHRNLWQDVWSWLQGEKATGKVTNVADESQLLKLQADLKSEDSSLRRRAADELGLIGEAAGSCAHDLGCLLYDSDETVALNAAYSLGHIGSDGVRELLEHLTRGTNMAAARAAYGLQAAGAQAIAGLIEILEHEDENRRALAAFTLGMLGASASQAVPALIASLNDDNEWVRRNIVEALGMIVQPADQVVPALVEALENSLNQESAAAKNPTGLYVQNQEYITNKIGYTAALSLLRAGKHGDENLVVSALKQALDSNDRYVRAYAAEALTHLRTDNAIDVLIHYYRSSRWCPDTHKASTF